MKSVLQDWVMELPLREQGTLLTCVRGCDLAVKPAKGEHEPIERRLVAFLRYTFLNPADARELSYPGAFMCPTLPDFNTWKASQLGHFPWHWISHLMHGYQIVSHRHPDEGVRVLAKVVYERLVYSMHLEPEPFKTMVTRLSEDRIESGKVVS